MLGPYVEGLSTFVVNTYEDVQVGATILEVLLVAFMLFVGRIYEQQSLSNILLAIRHLTHVKLITTT